MENGKTFGFVSDSYVKYADVVFGGKPITIMVRITGWKHAAIYPPMIMFKNNSLSYPIRGVAENVPDVIYRTSPEVWVDSKVFVEWLAVQREILIQSEERWRTLFVGNCSSHVENEDVKIRLQKLKTNLRKLIPCGTHFFKAAGSFPCKTKNFMEQAMEGL